MAQDHTPRTSCIHNMKKRVTQQLEVKGTIQRRPCDPAFQMQNMCKKRLLSSMDRHHESAGTCKDLGRLESWCESPTVSLQREPKVLYLHQHADVGREHQRWRVVSRQTSERIIYISCVTSMLLKRESIQ